MAKAAKPETGDVETEAADAPPRKNRKKLILFIVATALLVGGGAAAFLLLQPEEDHARKRGDTAHTETARPEEPPKFVDLGQFTANLTQDGDDRYLQIAISLKIANPELEEKIKQTKPEILHRINMLLTSKTSSELSTFDGKEQLSRQIRAQVEYVLGLRKIAPAINTEPGAVPEANIGKSGITDVLFTSFIIQ